MKLRTLKFHFPPNLVSSGGKSHSFEDCSSVLKETLLKDHAEGSMSYVLSFKASISTCAPSIPRIYPYLPPSKQTNVFAMSLKSCLTLCDPMDCSPPGSHTDTHTYTPLWCIQIYMETHVLEYTLAQENTQDNTRQIWSYCSGFQSWTHIQITWIALKIIDACAPPIPGMLISLICSSALRFFSVSQVIQTYT